MNANNIVDQKSKPWHENITNDMRHHLVQKIIQIIFPSENHSIYQDPRLANLANYAIKTECQMYEEAQNQEEYFDLLAERIYKIKKEFENKQRSSVAQKQEEIFQTMDIFVIQEESDSKQKICNIYLFLIITDNNRLLLL